MVKVFKKELIEHNHMWH